MNLPLRQKYSASRSPSIFLDKSGRGKSKGLCSQGMTEDTLYIFMEEKLKMEEEEASDICIERAHCLGKRKDDNKPRPIIAKFSLHKDKERILSKAYKLVGTGLGWL